MNILEFVLSKDKESSLYRFNLDIDIAQEGGCDACYFNDFCGDYNYSVLIKKGDSWEVAEREIICDIIPIDTFGSFRVCYSEQEKIEPSGNFIGYSEEGFMYDEDTDESKPSFFTTSELIEVFCKSDFCPIMKKNLECFKGLECPFKNVFEKYKTEIAFIPPTP